MNFSKLKLQEGVATSAGATASIETSQKGKEAATMGAQTAQTAKQMGNERLRRQRAQKADPRGAGQVFENMQKRVEQIKAYESKKSDWRQDLNEKVVDGQEREQHPYVTVMPTGDENLINAVKQMGKGVKEKRDEMKGQVKEDVQQLDEKKKKCKEGYKRDEDGNCVKEKKSKTNIIVGRGWGYGHDHDEHDDSNDNGADGGGDAGGGDGGGGMGEMFDALGDMLLKEKLETGKEYHARMKEKSKSPINAFPVSKNKAADKQRKQADTITKDTRTDAQKMTDATGPRPGSRYRGD
jgi:hypothetical protein